jgi:hypothetical protein
MPCPHFEPQRIALRPAHANSRLPLIDEYDGLCHADDLPADIPASARFRFCNHGYSRGECGKAVTASEPRSNRFELVKRDQSSLELLVIEEQEYAPLRWAKIIFSTAEHRLEPEPADLCLGAQLRAFCESYLRHFPDRRIDVQN